MSTLTLFASALRAPFLNFAKFYNERAKKSPAMTGIVTTIIKTSAADLFAQKVVEKRDEVDLRRHAMFCTFGFVYLGCFQYYLYNHLFVRICLPITRAVGHKGSAVVKTAIDQFIHHPVLYFPTFYLFKGAVESRPAADSMRLYKEHVYENCKALWSIWIPAQLINFGMVPPHLRIPFVAGVSFLWTVVMSVMRGRIEIAEAQVEAAHVAHEPSMLPMSGTTTMVSLPLTSAIASTLAGASPQEM